MNLQGFSFSITLNHSITVEVLRHSLQHRWLFSLLLISSKNVLLTMLISPLEGLISRYFVLNLNCSLWFFKEMKAVFQHNAPLFFPVEGFFGICFCLLVNIQLGTTFCFSTCLCYVVRVVLHCSVVISCNFVILPAKISRFPKDLILFIPSASFF